MVSKKAVSLMVSYVILISIAIGLSIGVYAWSKDYLNIFEPKIDCKEGTSLFIDDFTYDEDIINLSLKNNGYFNISGFIVSYSNESGRTPIDLLNATGAGTEGFPPGHYYFDPPLKPGEIYVGTFSGDNITVIQIQPFILDKKGDKIMCEQAVIKQNIHVYFPDIFDIYSFPGLVSWWKFEGDAVDSGPGGNDGTINGAISTTGKSGNALEFDGLDDYVQILDSLSLDITQDLTIIAWVNSTGDYSYSPGYYVVAKRDAAEQQFAILLNEDDIFLYTFGSPDQVGFSNTDILANKENQWLFVAGTIDSSGNVKVYLDGSDVTSDGGADPMTTAISDIYIGARGDGAGGSLYNFNGTIDEVMIFNTTLSAQNISDIYNSYN